MRIMALGKRVRERRQELGLTQTQLAEAIGKTQSVIQSLESRDSKKSQHVEALARALRVSTEWLLTGRGPKHAPLDHDHAPAAGSGVAEVVEAGPPIRARVPLISWTTAGNWGEVVDNFAPGDAEDWIATTAKVGPHAFALRIRGESMAPTIPDGAIVIVDPDAEPRHRSIVIVRQNHDSEATCKRLIYEGDRPMIRPDNPAYVGQVAPLADDARIVGVVRQVVVDLE